MKTDLFRTLTTLTLTLAMSATCLFAALGPARLGGATVAAAARIVA